ncbi:hypothetical protein HOY82DRAFT_275067 [Tuber indicum]|nr:hypothetical protein HOY82DRAFT_275067 [Tuber indicum]
MNQRKRYSINYQNAAASNPSTPPPTQVPVVVLRGLFSPPFSALLVPQHTLHLISLSSYHVSNPQHTAKRGRRSRSLLNRPCLTKCRSLPLGQGARKGGSQARKRAPITGNYHHSSTNTQTTGDSLNTWNTTIVISHWANRLTDGENPWNSTLSLTTSNQRYG